MDEKIYNRPFSKKAGDMTSQEIVELLNSMTDDEKQRCIKNIYEQLGIEELKGGVL